MYLYIYIRKDFPSFRPSPKYFRGTPVKVLNRRGVPTRSLGSATRRPGRGRENRLATVSPRLDDATRSGRGRVLNLIPGHGSRHDEKDPGSGRTRNVSPNISSDALSSHKSYTCPSRLMSDSPFRSDGNLKHLFLHRFVLVWVKKCVTWTKTRCSRLNSSELSLTYRVFRIL